MAKKIKFPLEVANGVQARTIEELKDNFDIDKMLEYFIDGKLQTWLEDRYYEEEAEKIAGLSISQADLRAQLAKVFGVTYDTKETVDVESIEVRNQKLKKLKQFTEDEEILRNVDSVAFDQEELSELYDSGIELIYLCEGEFNIPKSKQNLKYIELGGATVKGKSTTQAVKKNDQNEVDQHSNSEVIVRLSGKEVKPFLMMAFPTKNDLIISEVNGSNKKKVAKNVTAFARNHNTLVYVEIDEERNEFKFFRYDIATNIKTILNIESERSHNGYITNLFLTDTSIIWAQGTRIYMADYDGDFKEIISGTGVSSKIKKMQVIENTLYFLPEVKVETGFLGEVKYQPVYKVDLSTKRRTTLTNNVHAFAVGINKVYYANMEYKVYECDFGGNNVKMLHNLKPGHRLSDLNYESGSLILHHSRNTDNEIIKVSE